MNLVNCKFRTVVTGGRKRDEPGKGAEGDTAGAVSFLLSF